MDKQKGRIERGSVNNKPSSPKPNFKPSGQKPTTNTNTNQPQKPQGNCR